MKKLLIAVLSCTAAAVSLGQPAIPATRTYVATCVTGEAQTRRAADDALLTRLTSLDATLALVQLSVDNLASNLQASASSLSDEQLATLVTAVSNVSSNLSERATQLQTALHQLMDDAASVHITTNWSDRCVIELGELTPWASNEYHLASWPERQHDGRVRQYLATFSTTAPGFLRVPAGVKTDLDCEVGTGTHLLVCTDINTWMFVQLRALTDTEQGD